MKNSVLQRIRMIIDYYSLSDRKFAEIINVPQTTISSLFKRGNEPNVSITNAILNAYTDISVEWLLFGRGEMLKEPLPPKLNHIEGDFIGGTFVGGNNSGNIKGSTISKTISSDSSDNSILENETQHIKVLKLEIESLKTEMNMLKGENRILREQLGLGERK